VLATALDSNQLARRWALHPDGSLEGDPSKPVRTGLLRAASTGRSQRIATWECDVSFEVVRPARRLVVFGAGPDAEPVARLGAQLGWDVELVDHRPAYARPDRFPGARVHLAPTEAAVAQVGVGPDSYVLVMTHHYLIDRALLSQLLPSQAPYIGLLGPRRRADDLLADIDALGIELSAEQRARLHAPAGLDIGGEGPEAIALSLLAEVMASAEHRPAGWLRDRKGPIHEPEPG
jgi:xanthine dehydrogenase accessory factor